MTAANFLLAKTTGNPVAETLMSKLKETFPDLLEAVPEDQRRQIKATPEVHTTRRACLLSEKACAIGEWFRQNVDEPENGVAAT